MTDTIATCSGCKHWQPLHELNDGQYKPEDGTGRCRRYPPATRRVDLVFSDSINAMDAANSAYWPVTWDDDWCGEFQDGQPFASRPASMREALGNA